MLLAFCAFTPGSRSTGAIGPSEDAQILMSDGPSGFTLRNDSDTLHWSECRVSLDGGYFHPGTFSLPPHGKETIYFSDFRTASGSARDEEQVRFRFLRSKTIICRDSDGREQELHAIDYVR